MLSSKNMILGVRHETKYQTSGVTDSGNIAT
jgi:hypothetical protein